MQILENNPILRQQRRALSTLCAICRHNPDGTITYKHADNPEPVVYNQPLTYVITREADYLDLSPTMTAKLLINIQEAASINQWRKRLKRNK